MKPLRARIGTLHSGLRPEVAKNPFAVPTQGSLLRARSLVRRRWGEKPDRGVVSMFKPGCAASTGRGERRQPRLGREGGDKPCQTLSLATKPSLCLARARGGGRAQRAGGPGCWPGGQAGRLREPAWPGHVTYHTQEHTARPHAAAARTRTQPARAGADITETRPAALSVPTRRARQQGALIGAGVTSCVTLPDM